ncbi:MAG TPA: glycosyl hydrolase family 65 protein [Candidatus Binatia bacterium]|nr:glycosyl hydrolase family 65 protein [Candidatus Binatia bacterium]
MNRVPSPVDVSPDIHGGRAKSPCERELQARDPALSVLPSNFCTSDPRWLLLDEGFTLAREHETESLFAIANGYMGNRGSLAEGSRLSAPATFVAGIFEQFDTPGSVPALMVLPDWTGVRIWIDRRPLTMQQGEVLEHRRILDFRHGVLWREWRHRDSDGRITRLVTFRLASLADRHLLLHCVTFIAENYNSVIRFESSMETTDLNVPVRVPEWRPERNASRPNVLPLELEVPGRHETVAFGLASQLLTSSRAAGRRAMYKDRRKIMEACEVEVRAGTHCHLHRLLSVYTSRYHSNPFARSMEHVRDVLSKGVAAEAAAHAAQWESRWNSADIVVEGDDALQRALRFACYHLISAANPDDGRVSIGARTLSGAAYKGHVFWDTETYMLPFFIYTHPRSAEALLEYRYHTLEAARSKARSFGFRGAMYPWESADTGDETTPANVIAPNGEVLRVLNGELEIHITTDVAYAVWQHWQATGDDHFFQRFGAEIMLETARFWASRGALEPDGFYHIRHVIGPDEYHEDVDDNAFTNLMAAWNLRRGLETAGLLQERWPERWRELAARLQFSDDEVSSWQSVAAAMFIPFDPETLLYEQFSGYYRKQHVDLKSYEPRSAAMDTILGHDAIQKTDVVKQADVVLATFLLWDEIGPEVRAANFRYYEPQTGHGSSLSPSIHALLAARIGDRHLAEAYLKQAAEIDLGNNMGNAAGGVHAAALGGLWQALVFGFAGFRPRSEGVSFAPALLPHWRRLSFPLQWRGRRLQISMEPAAIRVRVSGEQPLRLSLESSSDVMASDGHEYVAERTESGWRAWQAVRP